MYPKEDEWAFRKMHEDVTDAANDLIASGLVDRNRVAIMGTGFGGYLALCGVAFEPSLYRCAVAISAHYDWGKLIEEAAYSKYETRPLLQVVWSSSAIPRTIRRSSTRYLP